MAFYPLQVALVRGTNYPETFDMAAKFFLTNKIYIRPCTLFLLARMPKLDQHWLRRLRGYTHTAAPRKQVL